MTQTLTRSIEEITASARMNMQDMVNRAIALGHDFIDAKEQLGHGEFLPWLKKLGISSSTASNYMKVAREIQPGSRLAEMPYSKALALLSAPADQRDELADAAEDKSAAEIRKLIDERNRATEAANIETNRANCLQNELNKAKQYSDSLYDELSKTKADLLTAENNRIEVEVIPADYERLKENQAMLMNAATEAEERAAAAEAQLEEMRMNGQGQTKDVIGVIHDAVRSFMFDCEMLVMPDVIIKNDSILADINWIESWCAAIRNKVSGTVMISD